MVWVDYVIIGIVLLSTVIAVVRGFVKEAFSLAGLLLAVWIALTFSSRVAPMLSGHVETPSLRNLLAIVILFVGTLLVTSIINHFACLAIKKTGLTGTDRLIGALFGLARGVALVAVLILLGRVANLDRDPWWQQSRMILYVQPLAGWIEHLLPDDVRTHIDRSKVDLPVQTSVGGV